MKIDRQWLRKALSDISLYGQIGFQVVVPPIILGCIAAWINKKFVIGYWIVIVAIVVGLVCAFTSLYRICRFYLEKNTKEDNKDKLISYRKHS